VNLSVDIDLGVGFTIIHCPDFVMDQLHTI